VTGPALVEYLFASGNEIVLRRRRPAAGKQGWSRNYG
jgi:hypothetical protein